MAVGRAGKQESGMDQRMKGRVALVTGSGRGIGEAIAGRLCREGAHVWVADIDEPEAQAVAARLGDASATRVDITDDTSVAALAEAIRRRHGHLDMLVNNAAILDMTAYDDMTIERFMQVHDVNLNGMMRVTLSRGRKWAA